MKILFFGDCMFGRNGNPFVKNPFKYVEKYIKRADIIIFNLETVISPNPISDNFKEEKVFNYQSTGEQLITLKQLTNKLILASITNNHSLDFGVYGFNQTKNFLKKYNIKYSSNKRETQNNNIIFIEASDHCGCYNIDLWKKHIWIIDYNNLDPVIKKIRYLAQNGKTIIFSIHWGSNWLTKISENMNKLGKLLIDNGVKIVFGHGAHHIPPKVTKKYKNGLIIYGLGDFINDYAIDVRFESNKALMCEVDLKENKFKLVPVKRKFFGQSSIPMVF